MHKEEIQYDQSKMNNREADRSLSGRNGSVSLDGRETRRSVWERSASETRADGANLVSSGRRLGKKPDRYLGLAPEVTGALA
jgi:hypothetical protein